MTTVRAVVIATTFFFCACVPIRRNLVVTVPGAPHGTAVQFTGIEASLGAKPLAKLLVIHGMGEHDFQYADRIIASLQTQMRLTPFACHARRIGINFPDDAAHPDSEMTICDYRRADGKVLRIYTLLWSPLTTSLKHQNLKYDWTQYGSGRKWANRAIKESIIDRSLSDAVLYSGGFAPHMRYAVKQAICATINDQYDLSSPCTLGISASRDTIASDVFIVTHSLGSMMLLESLDELGRSAPEAVGVLGRHVKLVTMLANQLPLLALARRESGAAAMGAVRSDNAGTNLRLDAFFALRKSQEPLMIVAFSDQNDLLSFPIPDDWPVMFPNLAGRVTFVNAFNANAQSAILGIVANPGTAHTGYWANKNVARVLSRGYP